MKPCPCGSQKSYKECCGRFHRGEAPPTAEALMRSRFAAYAVGNCDYILTTTHPQHADRSIPLPTRRKQIEAFCQSTHFERLEILSADEGEEEATVTFRATLKQGKKDVSFTEKSFFKKNEGRWAYLRGVIIHPSSSG